MLTSVRNDSAARRAATFGDAGHMPPIEACNDVSAPSGSLDHPRAARRPAARRRNAGVRFRRLRVPATRLLVGRAALPHAVLLHGGGGDQADWVTFGGIQKMLDDAYAARPVARGHRGHARRPWRQLARLLRRHLHERAVRPAPRRAVHRRAVPHDRQPQRPRHRRAVERRLRRAPARGEGARHVRGRRRACRPTSAPQRWTRSERRGSRARRSSRRNSARSITATCRSRSCPTSTA